MQPRKEHYRGKLPHYQQPGQWYSVTCSLFGAMPKGAMEKYSMQLEETKNRLLEMNPTGVGLSGVGVSNSDKFSGLGNSESQGFGLSQVRQNIELGNSMSRGVGLSKSNIEFAQAKKDYQIAMRKYRLAYDKILHNSNQPTISLIKENNRTVIEEALRFWEGKRLTSHAWCIMSNHFHWILTVYEKELGVGLSKSDNEKPVYLQDILHSVKLFTARRINENEGRTGQFWEHESFDTTIRNERHFSNVFNYVINNPVSAGLVSDWRDWPGTLTFLSP